MRWLLLLILVVPVMAQEVYIEHEELSVEEEVHEIANVMMTVENKLRDDQHNHTVQIAIQETIDRMEKLIKDAEEIEECSPDHGRKDSLLALKYGAPRSLKRPPKPSTDPKDKVQYDERDNDEWARLPQSKRGEIM